MKRHYYTCIEDCKAHKFAKSHNKNIRYPHFNQTLYTAGDVDQFYEVIKEYNEDIRNTFMYLYQKFKKGIFVRIKNNKLHTFLPFSKNCYENEWSHLIMITRKWRHLSKSKFNQNLDGLMNYINQNMGYHTKYQTDLKLWYANNALVRNEFPTREGESGILEMFNMFNELCSNRTINDCYFFVNRRDFPILKKDRTEAYDCIFGKNHPLVSNSYQNYCEILGMSGTNEFSDRLIPTWEDWCRISSEQSRFFPRNAKDYRYQFCEDWDEKKNVAVFRGGSTGIGITENTNMRIKISKMNIKDLDAGITYYNLRPRFCYNEAFNKTILDTIDVTHLPKLVTPLTPEEQSKYKYIVHIDGHQSAFRLSLELKMMSVILWVKTENKLWFSDKLVNGVHYIQIQPDLSDLEEKICWCQENDDKCKEISRNALTFYNENLQENSILDYLQTTLNNITTKPLHPIYKTFTYDLKPKRSNEVKELHNLFTSRDVGWLKGVGMILDTFDLSQFRVIHQQNNMSILSYKSLKIIKKVITTKHEAFIGLKCGNKLREICPNFMWSYAYHDNCLYTEFIEGIEFQTWLKDSFNVDDYLMILLQLNLAISIAQTCFNFCHYDLSPWNIIIHKLEEPITVSYPMRDKCVRIKTRIIPIIIDYGKSGAQIGDTDYTIYDYSSIIDTLTILIKSLNTILLNRVSGSVSSNLLTLANWMTNTDYQKKSISSIYTLRQFLKIKSKYDNLIFMNKYELEDRNPIEFSNWLINTFKLSVGVDDKYTIPQQQHNCYSIYHTFLNQKISFNYHNNYPDIPNKVERLWMCHYVLTEISASNLDKDVLEKIKEEFKSWNKLGTQHKITHPFKSFILKYSYFI